MTHREGLLNIYESQVESGNETPFMKLVLKEAICKLKETKEKELPSKRIENWVVKLEKTWRNP